MSDLKGMCPKCATLWQVKLDGTIRLHIAKDHIGGVRPGSNHPPASMWRRVRVVTSRQRRAT